MNQPYFQLLWIDLEMSGLHPINNRILQFACVLTDSQLNSYEEGPHIIIKCDEEHLKTMDEWNKTHHTSSGLYKSCLESDITIQKAQQMILTFLKEKKINQGQLTIAGNSVHQDKFFMFHHMPRLNQFLHYRILDVSSLKLIVNSRYPNIFYKKQNTHRALDDIRESIGQLQHYLKHAFK